MKYHNLYINITDTNVYPTITEILKLKPNEENPSSTWCHQVIVNDNDPYFDFINFFLDSLEPNLNRLMELGIQKSNIMIWLIYEYHEQCSLEFHSQEMLRLGKSGIGFNIDCVKRQEL